ncbi:uncharacterized protein [Coffea arabica]|uniref:Uncharacterized protein isoform X3 n=1 Tax=Coffea arabica TaxID=13443 RepID=A0ABM4U0H2_COFAR
MVQFSVGALLSRYGPVSFIHRLKCLPSANRETRINWMKWTKTCERHTNYTEDQLLWNQLKIDGVFVAMIEGSNFIGKFGSYCKFFLLVREENLLVCAHEDLLVCPQENLSSLYLLGICYVSTCY